MVMSQNFLKRPHIHTVLQRRGSESMAEVMESEVFQSGVLQDLLVEVHH